MMVKWCMNRLIASTPTFVEELFLLSLFTDRSPWDKLIPEPDWKQVPLSNGQYVSTVRILGSEVLIKPDGTADRRWRDWRMKHWGVEWDLMRSDVLSIEDYYSPTPMVIIEFKTPCEPPTGIYYELLSRGYLMCWQYQKPGEKITGELKVPVYH